MSDLKRITTQFIENEDRIRLSGEVGANQTVTLWLTQRLMSRLVTNLVAWLDTQTLTNVRPEVLQEFAQVAAQARLTPQAPVLKGALDVAWLVVSVDVTSNQHVMQLAFKGTLPAELTKLNLNSTQLRQWLGIVLSQYRLAQWTLDCWPEWMKGDAFGGVSPSAGSLH